MPARLHGNHQASDPVTIDSQHHFLWRRDNPLTNLKTKLAQNAKLQAFQACRHDGSNTFHKITKRSPEATPEEEADGYGSYVQYRPRSVPSDSYWFQHRTTKPSQVYSRNRDAQRKARGNPEPVSTQDSEEFHWAESQKVTEPDAFYYSQPVGRQIGVNQPTAIMLEEENIFNQNPSENLPFLTRRAEHPEASERFDTNSRYTWSNPRPDESRNNYEGPARNRNSFYVGRNQSGTLSRDFQDAKWVTQTNGRKGRNDEEIFGANWKSSLDTELSWTEPAGDS
ncbi:unnamed protein product, partial [Allacma fusca]